MSVNEGVLIDTRIVLNTLHLTKIEFIRAEHYARTNGENKSVQRENSPNAKLAFLNGNVGGRFINSLKAKFTYNAPQ